jgi:hypothetical protein
VRVVDVSVLATFTGEEPGWERRGSRDLVVRRGVKHDKERLPC